MTAMTSNSYKSDAALIAACLADEPEAWNHFMAQYRRLIRSTSAKVRHKSDVASVDTDDLEHHIYQKLLEDDRRRIRAWQGRSRFSTYLVQVTRNLVIDYYALRDKGPLAAEYPADEPTANPGAEVSREEQDTLRRAAFETALKQLPEKQALLIRLRMEGKSLSEIATITGRPLGTIGVENSRALARLRAAILAEMKVHDGED